MSQAIFSILDHSLRRNADQERVIGTLLGTRSEDGEVEVRSAFAVGHSEAEDQVEVDMEYHKQMLALHLKANPREVLVGWYATASELNTFSALIQNFYSGQGDGTWPHPAVHLTVSTEAGKDLETRAYISAPVGVTAERAADSAAFIPVPYELRYGEADKSGLEAIANAKDAEERSTGITTDVEALERAIEEVLSMIDRVSRYVESVIDEEAPASTAMGQFLLNALALAPKVEPADIERDLYVSFVSHLLIPTDSRSNNHIQDVLVVSYLANTIRTQMELSNRLATAQLTLGGGEGAGAGEGQQRGQRGGRGGRQNRPQERAATEEAQA